MIHRFPQCGIGAGGVLVLALLGSGRSVLLVRCCLFRRSRRRRGPASATVIADIVYGSIVHSRIVDDGLIVDVNIRVKFAKKRAVGRRFQGLPFSFAVFSMSFT